MMRRARGFSLFEFAVCAALSALLAGSLLARLMEYQAASERAAVQRLVASVRTALALRTAQVLATRGEAGMAVLLRENPLSWLERMPENYQGVYYRPELKMLKTGHWHFDPSDHSINFLQASDTFTLRTSKLLKFKVELLRIPDRTRSGGNREGQPGLMLAQVTEPPSSRDY